MDGYLFLTHTESETQPITLSDDLFLIKPEENENDDDIFVLTVPNIDNNAKKLWISLWFDYAYGETLNTSHSRDDIIDKFIEQLKTDYDVDDIDTYVEYTLKKLKNNNCVVLKNHPLEPDEDLTPPVLVIKEVSVI